MSTAVTLIVNKVIMGFVALVAIWNLTKLPYYLGFNNDGNETYNDSTGVELSINLGHWFDVSDVFFYYYCFVVNYGFLKPPLFRFTSYHVFI